MKIVPNETVKQTEMDACVLLAQVEWIARPGGRRKGESFEARVGWASIVGTRIEMEAFFEAGLRIMGKSFKE